MESYIPELYSVQAFRLFVFVFAFRELEDTDIFSNLSTDVEISCCNSLFCSIWNFYQGLSDLS